MDHINFNGKLLPADTAIIGADNRGLRFGDGLFETIKFRNNNFLLIEQHFERLWTGMELMQFELPQLFHKEFLWSQLWQLVQKNKHTHARVRLNIVRGNGGLYDAVHMRPDFIIQSWQLPDDYGQLNSNGLQLCFYREAVKPCDAFSNCKHNNYLPYFMGALAAKKNKCNDALLLNQYGRICDSTIANVFIIKNNVVKTPPLSEGCVAGTMRQFLLAHLPALGLDVTECPLSPEEIAGADEIFLSNAMTPIKWVAAVDGNTFRNNNTLIIYEKMRQAFPVIFC